MAGDTYQTIGLERRGPVALLTLRRPERLNAINKAMLGELQRALDAVEPDEAIRALVVTGAGGSFSSGFDLKEQMEARPLALPLSIAYTGDGPPAFWKMNEDLLGLLLEAGFERRQAVVLIRAVSNLVSGYLLLMRQDTPEVLEKIDSHEIDLLRRRFELAQLSLPRDRFPHSVESAREVADVWLNDPDLWWRDTVDLLVFGLEKMLERSRAGSPPRP
jgi:hypothetical protein